MTNDKDVLSEEQLEQLDYCLGDICPITSRESEIYLEDFIKREIKK